MNIDTNIRNKCRICLLPVAEIATLNIFDHEFRSVLVRFERLIGTALIRGPQLPTKICVRCVHHIKKALSDLDTWSQTQHSLHAQQIVFSLQENKQKKENNDKTLVAPSQCVLPTPSTSSANQQSCVPPNYLVMHNNTSNERKNYVKDCTLLDTMNNDPEFLTLLKAMNTTSTDFVGKLFDWSEENINETALDISQTPLGILPNSNVNFNQETNLYMNYNAEPLDSTTNTNLNRTELHNDKNLHPWDSSQNFDIINAPSVLEFTKPYLFGTKQNAKSNNVPTCTMTAPPSATPIGKPSLSDASKKSELKKPYSLGYKKETKKCSSSPNCTITAPPLIMQSNVNPSLSNVRPLPLNAIQNQPKPDPSLFLVGNNKNKLRRVDKHGDLKEAGKIQQLSNRKEHAANQNANKVRKTPMRKTKNPCLIRIRDCERICVICKHKFNCSDDRICHERYHNDDLISCDNCTKCFETIQDLRLHVSWC